ncbi:MAG TPA: cobalamin-dependent protein [Anaerolineaceae bacterium]|nr:cobalamin-dependent protein [Anaerolineaceae bacterium]
MENINKVFQFEYVEAMKKGSGRMADQVVEKALDQQVTANDVYLDIFQDTAYEIGRMWQRNEFSVAQEHLATAIIERQMGDLRPYFKPVRQRTKRLVIGSVDKELHRVGVRMVVDFFEQDGWEVYYLGATVPTDTFISIARDFNADLIGLSAQMVYHLPTITEFVKEADKQGLEGIPIMAGGFPFVQNPDLYKRLGVHFSGANAREALEIANKIVP